MKKCILFLFSLFFMQTVSADCNAARSEWDSALEQFKQAEAGLDVALQAWAIAREAHHSILRKWRFHCFSEDQKEKTNCSKARKEWNDSVTNMGISLDRVKQVM